MDFLLWLLQLCLSLQACEVGVSSMGTLITMDMDTDIGDIPAADSVTWTSSSRYVVECHSFFRRAALGA